MAKTIFDRARALTSENVANSAGQKPFDLHVEAAKYVGKGLSLAFVSLLGVATTMNPLELALLFLTVSCSY